MADERKTEVNRRLADFEVGNPNANIRYTEDLNALARLEAKLPAHEMIKRRSPD